MKRVTLATFKSFLRKNEGKLFIKVKSEYDGMTDGIEQVKGDFVPAIKEDGNLDNTLGYKGVWIVRCGRDYFEKYEDDRFEGIEVSNCCGNFIVAVKK